MSLVEVLVWSYNSVVGDQRHSRIPLNPALAVAVLVLAQSFAGAQDRNQLIFRQDLGGLGYKFHYNENDGVIRSFTDLAFLSEDLLLLSVREVRREELHHNVPPGRPVVHDDRAGVRTSSDSVSTLLLFSVEKKKLVRSAEFPILKLGGSVQAAGIGRFLMLTSSGLQMCAADFQCELAWRTEDPFYTSPRGTRVVVGGFKSDVVTGSLQFTEQQLLDTGTFSILQTFPASRPKVIPGDTGLLLQDSGAKLQMPGHEPLLLRLEGTYMLPETRFLDDSTVIGVRMGESHARAVVVSVDGKELYNLELKGDSADFFTSVSGARFGMIEMYSTRFASIVHYLDVEGTPLNRIRARVFEAASGKQVFETDWDPGSYRGSGIVPALSPAGHRLALARKGELRVYEIP